MQSLGTKETSCAQCGTAFTMRVSVPRTFCSRACKQKAQVRRTEQTCPRCEQHFFNTGRRHTQFCSKACANAALYRPVKGICQSCQRTYIKSPSRMSPFCSEECYETYRFRPLRERFWERVEKSEGCWLWTGNVLNTGYGSLEIQGRGEKRKLMPAHRFAYADTYGPIPAGLIIRHDCDNRPCVRPDHLRVGTQQDNIDDMVARDRGAYGEKCGRAKMTEDAVRNIRANPDVPLRVFAEQYGVSRAAVSFARRGTNWKHLV